MARYIKDFFWITLLGAFFLFNFETRVYATEAELNLKTEVLKNRQKDYSSLTDINGMNLFTDDVMKLIEKENKEKVEQKQKNKDKLFVGKVDNSKSEKIDTKLLFNNPVVFNKSMDSTEGRYLIEPLIIAITAIGTIGVFILTRRSYKKRGREENESDFNVYQ